MPHILIVDPDIGFMARLKKALEEVDFEVRAVGRTKAALRAIEKNQYDVAIIDLHFEEDEIFQLTEALRQYQPDSPIIFSGQYETDPEQVSKYHAQAFVNKPYIARDLIQIIEIALEKGISEDKFITPNMDFIERDVLDPIASPTPGSNYWLEVEPPPDEEATIRDLFLSFYDPEIEAEILREVGGEDSQQTLPPSTLPESVDMETIRATAAPLSQQNEPPLKDDDSPAKSAIRLSEDKARADTLLMNISSSWSNASEQPEIRSLPSWKNPTSPQDAARIQALIGNASLPNHLNDQSQNETMHHDDIEDPPYSAMTQPLSLPEIDLLAESSSPTDNYDTPPPSPSFPQQVNPQLIEALINAQTLDDSNLHAAIQKTTGDIQEHKTQPIQPIAIDEEELVATSVEEITRAMGVILPDDIENDTENEDDFDDYEAAEDTDVDIVIETDDLSPDAEAVNELLGEMDVIAHAALQLTQYSLESSALGTMLTHNDYPVARTGEFSDSAWQEVHTAITTAWEDDNDSRTRILYRPISEIGDVLLFSTRTVDDLTLTMVFGADTPLRIIRRQVMRLSDALAIESDTPITSAPASQPIETQEATSLPLPLEPVPTIDDVQAISKEVTETSSQKDNVPPAAQTLPSRPTNFRPPEKLKSTPAHPAEREVRAPGTYVGYACFWMLENESRRLDPTLTNALERWIHRTANKHDWDIIGIEIGDSWVNLHVEIPVKEIPSHVIYTFMESTAQHLTELAREDFQINTPIWAASYTVTTPGRLLESYEIERFMHYYQQQSL